ncbi:MAG: translation initiation factor eIF-2B [Alphaproteobacteria bacterium]|nr:translation initiation factor eIF-2B [Alphaproteobacteria bacterium]
MDEAPFQKRLDDLKADRRHGAAELARLALGILAESAAAKAGDGPALRQTLLERASRLIEARPSMAAVRNLLVLFQADLAGAPAENLDALRGFAAAQAKARIVESENAASAAAMACAAALGENRTLLTHSLSSTVLYVFHDLKKRGLRVIATESRPLFEGVALAERLSAWGVPTTLITEAEIGLFAERADACLVGADTVLENGDVLNKAGTYPLALAAVDAGVPFFVCAEGFKWMPDGSAPALEAMDPAELGVPAFPHVRVENIYFDRTPARLITAYFNEKGRIQGARP